MCQYMKFCHLSHVPQHRLACSILKFHQNVHVLTHILKAIKNATGTSVIFPKNISLIHFVFVPTSAPNVEERLTKS